MRTLMIDHLNEYFFGPVFLNRKTRNKSIDFFTDLVFMVPAFKKSGLLVVAVKELICCQHLDFPPFLF